MRLYFFHSLALCLAATAVAVGGNAFGQTIAALPPTGGPPTPGYAVGPRLTMLESENLAGQAVGEPAAPCCESCRPCDRWFGSVTGLVLGRDRANAFWTTYETNNNPNQLLNTDDADSNWGGGMEVEFGRWFDCECGCARNGIEVVYFFVDGMDGFASVRGDSVAAGTVSTTLDLQDPTTASGSVEVGGQSTALFFDGATEHRIWRNDEIQNLELNFLRQRLAGTDSAQLTWLAGIRYFRFQESLIFGSVQGGFEFGDNGGANEADLSFEAVNNLIGPQIGMRLDYQPWSRVGLFFAPKFGIYGNDVTTRSRLYTGDGIQGFDISGHTTEFSFLAQVDFGLNYQISSHWRTFIGYRVLAATGIALSDNQIPHYLAASDEMASPKTNGSLIVHGGMAGLEFRF